MIKKIFSLGFAVALTISGFAQALAISTIPVQVMRSFQSVYPSATNVTWTQESGYYVPTFTDNGKQASGYIDLKGQFIQTITKLSTADLPGTVTTYIKQNYNAAPIAVAGKIDFNTNHAPRYYAKVNGKELIFDDHGSFIKETQSPLKQ